MQEVALTLAVALAVSLNLIVLGLIWLCWKTLRGRQPDTFEGQTEVKYPERKEGF